MEFIQIYLSTLSIYGFIYLQSSVLKSASIYVSIDPYITYHSIFLAVVFFVFLSITWTYLSILSIKSNQTIYLR